MVHSQFIHEIAEALWVMDLAVVGCLVLGGVALAVFWVATGFRRRRHVLGLSSCIVCLALTVLFTEGEAGRVSLQRGRADG